MISRTFNKNSKRTIIKSTKPYKTDRIYMKLIADITKTGRHSKSLNLRKANLKNTLQTINNEIHFTKEPIVKILHEDNENFKNEYILFNKRIHRKQTKDIFKDLVKLYQLKGYRIPNFSINEHNLFKINPLLEASAEKMSNGLIEKQLSRKKKKDDSQKIMNYLKKLGNLLSEQMNLDSDEQKKLFKKFDVPKLKITSGDEDNISLLKKHIEIINNLINTDALGKLDEKPKRRKSISRQSSYKSMRLYSSKKRSKEKNLTKRRFSKPKISLYGNQKVYAMNFYSNKENDFFVKRQRSNVSQLSNNSNKSYNINILSNKRNNNVLLPNFFSNFSKKRNVNININNFFGDNNNNNNNNSNSKNSNKLINETKKSSSRSITSALAGGNNLSSFANQKNNEATIFNNLKVKFNESPLVINNHKNVTRTNLNTIAIPSISNHKTNLVFNKMQNNNLRLYRKIQTNENNNNEINELNDDYLLFSTLKPNHQTLVHRTRNNSNNFPYDNEEEFVNYAYEKFNTDRNYGEAEKMIKNYLQKVKKYNNEKSEEFINKIYDKKIFKYIKELKRQIQDNDVHAETERLYINNHMIKRIKPLLDNMDNKDNVIEKFDKSLINAVST